ncbi:MAG: lytic transglycosylase domain-containing protein [Alphaproteobacteria bacterium]
MIMAFTQRWIRGAIAMAVVLAAVPAWANEERSLAEWIDGLRSEATGKGIRAETLDRALNGVSLLPRVVELDRKQPEFTLTYQGYMSRVVSEARVAQGRAMLAKHGPLLKEISRKYGVQASYIVALWGVETDYGRITGGFSVVPALVTLAYDGRRPAYFRKELMNALTILDQGDIAPQAMSGSWAGAMGQNQFMPSSYLKFAEDYDGDGRRDIWHTQADVFASTANYLARSVWNGSKSWGLPVRLTKDFDTSLATFKTHKSLAEWSKLGIRRSNGKSLPSGEQMAALVITDDLKGPAFLVYGNFEVIRKWNQSNLFALAVGQLADRIERK